MPPLPKARGTKAIGLEQIPIAAWIDDGKQVLITNQDSPASLPSSTEFYPRADRALGALRAPAIRTSRAKRNLPR